MGWLLCFGHPTVLKVMVGFWIMIIGIYMTLPYARYFPPDFSSGFLFGREGYFYPLYACGFYAHIVSAPIVLWFGLIQSSRWMRRRYPKVHRAVGTWYVRLLLGAMLPGGAIIATRAYGGMISVIGFLFLCAITAVVTMRGANAAKTGKIEAHGRWMQRSYLLVCSAVLVRVLSVQSELWNLDPVESYRWIVWMSWLPSLVTYEAFVWRGNHAKRKRLATRPT
ncbi:MAG: DUF2306 domain-containing protein [Pirellulales bacterium]